MAERPPMLACRDHLLASGLRLIQAGPVPATPQTRGRTQGARHRDPAVSQRGCPRLKRQRRRLQQHGGLRSRRLGSRRAEAGKAEHPGEPSGGSRASLLFWGLGR